MLRDKSGLNLSWNGVYFDFAERGKFLYKSSNKKTNNKRFVLKVKQIDC